MVRSISLTVVFLAVLAGAAPSVDAQMMGVRWFKHRSTKYKIQVCLNTGMKLKASQHGRWGMMSARERGVRVAIMAYAGVATFPQLQKTAITVSKIPNRFWKRTRASAAWNGFGRNETYLAVGPEQVVVAFLAKHGRYIDRNYIVFLKTSKVNFLAKKAIFKAWGDCLHAIR